MYMYSYTSTDKAPERRYRAEEFPWPTHRLLRSVLVGPGVSGPVAKARHRQLLRFLHPDKFQQKFGTRMVDPDGLAAAIASVTAAAQLLNSVWKPG